MRNLHLVRSTDGDTSEEAADSLDLTVSGQAWSIVEAFLLHQGLATYRELGELLAYRGLFPSWEEGRRAVRTMKEEHNLLEWALDARGKHIRHTNSTHRAGWCLQLPSTGPKRRKRLVKVPG